MNLQRAIEKAAADPVRLALGAGLALGAVYLLGRAVVKDVGGLAGGLVSGDNAITSGTVYQGAGIAGTLGAGANAATGGLLEKAGEKIGGFFADLFLGDANLDSDRRARQILEDRARAAAGAAPEERAWYENLLGGLRP